MSRLAAAAFIATCIMWAPAAQAACTNPAGIEGAVLYNATHKVMQYCDNTSWIGMGWKNAPVAAAAGDAGEIQFSDGAAKFSSDTGLAWNNSAKQLKITSSPASLMLHAAGGGSVFFDMLASASIPGQLRFTTNSSANYIQSGADTTSGSFKALSIGPLNTSAGADSKLFIATNGNVGIGTSTPATKLDVAGTIRATNFQGTLNGLKILSGYASFSNGTCGDTHNAPCIININAGSFSGPPHCTFNMMNKDGTSYTERMVIQDITTTQLRLWRGNYKDTGTTMQMHWMCIGA